MGHLAKPAEHDNANPEVNTISSEESSQSNFAAEAELASRVQAAHRRSLRGGSAG